MGHALLGILRPGWLSAQSALQQRLKSLALDRKNEQRAVELAAVVKQAELQRAQKQVKQLTQELEDEQASAERSARRAALEAHNALKVRLLLHIRCVDEIGHCCGTAGWLVGACSSWAQVYSDCKFPNLAPSA